MSDELKNAIDGMAARRRAEPHPDPDQLVAYHCGDLSAEEEERLRDHLASCAECAGLLLDLDGLADADFGAGSGDDDKEAVWARLRQEIPSNVVPIQRPALSSPRWLQALAASLLVATIGLSLWVTSLRRTVVELSQPEPNAAVLDLYSSTSRGEGSPPAVFSVPAGVRRFTVILSTAGQRRLEGYRIEILHADGRAVWSGGGFKPNEFGSLSLGLSRRLLRVGEYRIRLLGEGGEPIEEYALRIEDDP
jgi:hypothetical protein